MLNITTINTLCAKKGWTKSRLCAEMGVNSSFFVDLKNEKFKISQSKLEQIADLLDTTVDVLLGFSEQKEKAPEEGSLSEEEKYLVELYKKADGGTRVNILTYAKTEVEKAEKKTIGKAL